ncbi:uncharacterized protein TRUGW13939_03571 [Talaromyces rugulosus]|jgi:mRNA export factor|uniref:Essential protein Yae1 N-terminal domain-containing protein n=1 Tax=Talaromyces rugulosus TaxID=121627 RepID=A0A7H8QRJ9_TALRU|nr:uncharacterized protein TRUGW13939_03571 [Talaromyces rugulosus]QKX56466.1 hypothetical protein TRUGW13939_03571 [Talaromyces rugulosus]
MDSDLLESVLGLEEKFYHEGYQVGLADGARAGYTEGSVFAVEKGFAQALEVGKLYGKALVWNQRFASRTVDRSGSSSGTKPTLGGDDLPAIHTDLCYGMPEIRGESRVARNIQLLLGLVDPATLSLENTEDAVSDMEERLKGAQLKTKLIQRSLGESDDSPVSDASSSNRESRFQGDGSGSIEDISSMRIRH